MLILDLRVVLFAGLMLMIAAGCGLLFGTRRVMQRGRRDVAAVTAGEVDLMLDAIPAGVVILDGARSYALANEAARRLLGLPARRGLLPEDEWEDVLAVDRASARRTGATIARYQTLKSSLRPAGVGTGDEAGRVVSWRVCPLSERLDLLFLLDVTDQRRAEEAARSLVNDVSHEVRTPLATMLTHVEVLSLPAVPDEVRQQSLRLLKDEARRMVRLLQQMLDLGRLETRSEIDRRPVDLHALVEQILAQVAPAAEERQISISLDADPGLPLVLGDADGLRQVFLNLLDNAAKYCRTGDTLSIRLRGETGSVCCTVRDSGPGIAAKHLPHLTRRFYRADRGEGAGSGLGLALVEEILRRHGSRVEIESRTIGADTGTSVRFRLPVAGGIAPAGE